MRRTILLILPLFIALSAGGDAAAQIRVDLPDLPGVYETGFVPPDQGPGGFLFSLTLPAELETIAEIRLVLSGTMQEGLVSCSNPYGGPPDTTASRPGLSLYLWESGSSDFLHATVEAPHGAFSGLAAPFTSCCPPGVLDPNTLLGKELQAEFFLDWVLILPCGWVVDAAVVLEDAYLEITGTVPAEDTAWGAVKARYGS